MPPLFQRLSSPQVGATTLSRAMAKVAPLVVRRPEVLMGIDSPDDCAVVAVPGAPGALSVHTVDFFRSFYEVRPLSLHVLILSY